MSEKKSKYVSIDGTVIEFRKNKIYLGLSNLRDFAWTPRVSNNRITGFDAEILAQKSVPIYIEGRNFELRNFVFETFEKDVLYKKANPKTKKSGKLFIGDYYICGFFIANTNSPYLNHSRYLKREMTFVATSRWIREQRFTYIADEERIEIPGHDYPFDFPIDFGSRYIVPKFENNALVSSKFKLTINGPVCSPIIYINDNPYNVDVVVEPGETLTIDSFNKEIYITKANGKTQNCFAFRSNGIFEAIVSGKGKIVYSNDCNIELIIYDERSEPKWI